MISIALVALAALLFSVQPADAKLRQIAKRCQTPDCYFGYSCTCSCASSPPDDPKNVSVSTASLNMYGGCYYCNSAQCDFSYPNLCEYPHGRIVAGCEANCDVAEVVADGSCQNWYTQEGKQLAYSLTCDGDNYRGLMGLTCDNLNFSFSGDDNTCHWTEEFGGVGLSIDCRYGISNGGIVAIVFACILFPIFCCWLCTLDEYDEECCPGCAPRVKARRRTKARKVAPVVPVEKENVGDTPAKPEKKKESEVYVEMAER